MEEEHFVPRYKMLVSYNIRPGDNDAYYQFVLGEMVPALQEMGLFMAEAWHTSYGPYPIRLIGFVSEDYETMSDLSSSEEFAQLESKLRKYVSNYSRKVVEFREGFQFLG